MCRQASTFETANRFAVLPQAISFKEPLGWLLCCVANIGKRLSPKLEAVGCGIKVMTIVKLILVASGPVARSGKAVTRTKREDSNDLEAKETRFLSLGIACACRGRDCCCYGGFGLEADYQVSGLPQWCDV